MICRFGSSSRILALLAALTAPVLTLPAAAADDAALYAARDSLQGDECERGPGTSPIRHYKFALPTSGATQISISRLYVVPCRATTSDPVSVLFREDEKGLHPVHLPAPTIVFTGNEQAPVKIDGFTIASRFSNFVVVEGQGIAFVRQPIATGKAKGKLEAVYQLYGLKLIEVGTHLNGRGHMRIPLDWFGQPFE